MIKKALTTIGIIATCISTSAQDVTPYVPGATAEGIVYYLPKTQLEIKVTATHSIYTPGELCQYAERYLKLRNVSAQPAQHWEIKDIQVNAIGIPDTAKVYSIKLKDKSAMALVDLTENGIIKAINTNHPDTPATVPAEVKPKKKRINPRDFMTEEILLAGSTNKMAELIAREIYNIRESKNSLNRGQADYMPQDGSALRIMLDNLNAQEKAMTEMFSGITETSDRTFTFYINPEKEMTNHVIFRFSKKLGILNENDLAGEPFYLSLTNEQALPAATEEPQAKKRQDGIIYNIPGKGLVTISNINKVYYKGKLPITQFGETEILVNQLFSKKINTRVIFNPETGGITKIDKD